MESCDVLVVGLGAMGSATTYQLARRGVQVLGIDQFSPPHTHGSTHGDTRITRQGVGEGSAYVPLVVRSHELWRELEAESGADLLRITGGLILAAESRTVGQHGTTDFVASTISAAREHDIDHDVVDTDEIRRRFPQFRVDQPHRGYYEPSAGLVFAERAVHVQLNQAERLGAAIHRNEQVLAVTPSATGVDVWTDRGRYAAGTVVLTAGPWLPRFLEPELASLFTVYRQVLHWFEIRQTADLFEPGRCPVFIWELAGDNPEDIFYGFPAVDGADGGLKVATETYAKSTDPDSVRREVTVTEQQAMYRRFLRDRIPSLGEKALRSASCLYTVTPDYGFVIDQHPEHDNLIIASPCSGHGFKHSAAIGEALSQLATQEDPAADLSPFSIGRFLSPHGVTRS